MRHAAVIVVAERDEIFWSALAASLHERRLRVVQISYEAIAASVRRHHGDLVVIASYSGDEQSVIAAANEIAKASVPIVLVAQDGSEQLAAAALRAGVKDYFRKPCTVVEVTDRIVHWLGRTRPHGAADGWTQAVDLPQIVGNSPPILQIQAYIARVAPSDTNVLITGETGTGKELAAALIHRWSPRAHRRFVAINCAAIPDGLLESELFGYERGAFTGAETAKVGQLQVADGGTVLLDEIGDMGPFAQAKLLRAVESREVYRLGSGRPIPVNVRVVAATNHDLERRVEEGAFRKDLYYRLNVARIHLPPLRDRRSDIPLLLVHYIGEMNRRYDRHVNGFNDDALERLVWYDWPGNVRELRNLVEAVFLNFEGHQIAVTDLPVPLQQRVQPHPATGDEREQLMSALVATNWNKSRTAEKLQWSRMTVYRKIAKYHLVRSPHPEAPQSVHAADDNECHTPVEV